MPLNLPQTKFWSYDWIHQRPFISVPGDEQKESEPSPCIVQRTWVSNPWYQVNSQLTEGEVEAFITLWRKTENCIRSISWIFLLPRHVEEGSMDTVRTSTHRFQLKDTLKNLSLCSLASGDCLPAPSTPISPVPALLVCKTQGIQRWKNISCSQVAHSPLWIQIWNSGLDRLFTIDCEVRKAALSSGTRQVTDQGHSRCWPCQNCDLTNWIKQLVLSLKCRYYLSTHERISVTPRKSPRK